VSMPLRVKGDPPETPPSLADRVATLEEKVAALEAALGSESTTVAALQAALNNEVAARQAADANLQTAIDTLSGQVSPVLAKVSVAGESLFLNAHVFVDGNLSADSLLASGLIVNGGILSETLATSGLILAGNGLKVNLGNILVCNGVVADTDGVVHGSGPIQFANCP
jgi:hypothetical protein